MRANPPTLRRGMPIRRQGSRSQCAIGPFFTGAPGHYFLTVEHGIGGLGGSRVVESCLDGMNWIRIGEYVAGAQDEKVDWAIVHIDDDIRIDTDPLVAVITDPLVLPTLPEKATGVGYSHQAGGHILFESTTFNCGDLNGRVGQSPTYRKQYQCLTAPRSRRADEGVSGMAVYDKAGDVLGIEWAIEWDGPAQRHTFYVQPTSAIVISFAETISALDNRYRSSRVPPVVWPLAKPLADAILEDIAEREKHAARTGAADLRSQLHLFKFIERNIV